MKPEPGEVTVSGARESPNGYNSFFLLLIPTNLTSYQDDILLNTLPWKVNPVCCQT